MIDCLYKDEIEQGYNRERAGIPSCYMYGKSIVTVLKSGF